MDQFAVGISASERHDQRVDDKVGGLAFAHGPAGQALVVEVLDAGQEQLAVQGGELGDVGHPPLVGAFRGEVAFQQVRGRRGVGAAPPPLAPRVGTHETELGHDPRHPLLAHMHTASAQLAHTRGDPYVPRDWR